MVAPQNREARMSELARISITLEPELLAFLDQLTEQAGMNNRSEFVRGLIRKHLIEEGWKRNEEAVGSITLVYNHEAHNLAHELVHLQHHYHQQILATTHVHLNEDLCVEVILIRGRARDIEELARQLRGHKGVIHGDISMGSTGKLLDTTDSSQAAAHP